MGTSLWDQSTSAGSNTSIGGVNVAEGCPPSGLNNGIRAVDAQALGALKSVTASGTDTYTATLAPVPDALSDGMLVQIRFTNANTSTTPTLNCNSLGAKTIKKLGGSALVAGDIPAAHDAILRYVSATTYWQLLNPVHTLADAANGGVTIAAGTVAINVNDLATDASPDVNADYLATYDASASASKKTLMSKVGKIAQVVVKRSVAFGADLTTTGTTVMPFDDTIPQNTEGDQYLSQAITPTNSGSTLIIEILVPTSVTGAATIGMALFQDTTADALAATVFDAAAGGAIYPVALTHKMTAGTTSATTFKVRIGPSASATISVNGTGGARKLGGVMPATLVITEILP